MHGLLWIINTVQSFMWIAHREHYKSYCTNCHRVCQQYRTTSICLGTSKMTVCWFCTSPPSHISAKLAKTRNTSVSFHSSFRGKIYFDQISKGTLGMLGFKDHQEQSKSVKLKWRKNAVFQHQNQLFWKSSQELDGLIDEFWNVIWRSWVITKTSLQQHAVLAFHLCFCWDISLLRVILLERDNSTNKSSLSSKERAYAPYSAWSVVSAYHIYLHVNYNVDTRTSRCLSKSKLDTFYSPKFAAWCWLFAPVDWNVWASRVTPQEQVKISLPQIPSTEGLTRTQILASRCSDDET